LADRGGERPATDDEAAERLVIASARHRSADRGGERQATDDQAAERLAPGRQAAASRGASLLSSTTLLEGAPGRTSQENWWNEERPPRLA